MEQKKVGLALGSGAARAMAHIGVLEVLEKEGIPVDMVAGTSAGAVVGALYAQGKSAGQIRKLVEKVNWKRLTPFIDPTLGKSGLIKGKKVKDLMKLFIGGDITFSDLKLPFVCVATDINSGEEVVMDGGPLVDALRATVSIPGIFAVVKCDGRYLVDGSLVNPVPVSAVKRIGADFVIAVNVIPDVRDRAGREAAMLAKEPKFFAALMQSMYIGVHNLVTTSVQAADVVIDPSVGQVGAGEFRRAEELIELGAAAARKCIPEIKKKLVPSVKTAKGVLTGGGQLVR